LLVSQEYLVTLGRSDTRASKEYVEAPEQPGQRVRQGQVVHKEGLVHRVHRETVVRPE